MAKKITIIGKVVYENLEGGFWGIKDEKGNNWLPVNMPEQLKHKGKKVEIIAERVEMMGIAMWGETIKIKGFSTMTP